MEQKENKVQDDKKLAQDDQVMVWEKVIMNAVLFTNHHGPLDVRLIDPTTSFSPIPDEVLLDETAETSVKVYYLPDQIMEDAATNYIVWPLAAFEHTMMLTSQQERVMVFLYGSGFEVYRSKYHIVIRQDETCAWHTSNLLHTYPVQQTWPRSWFTVETNRVLLSQAAITMAHQISSSSSYSTGCMLDFRRLMGRDFKLTSDQMDGLVHYIYAATQSPVVSWRLYDKYAGPLYVEINQIKAKYRNVPKLDKYQWLGVTSAIYLIFLFFYHWATAAVEVVLGWCFFLFWKMSVQVLWITAAFFFIRWVTRYFYAAWHVPPARKERFVQASWLFPNYPARIDHPVSQIPVSFCKVPVKPKNRGRARDLTVVIKPQPQMVVRPAKDAFGMMLIGPYFTCALPGVLMDDQETMINALESRLALVNSEYDPECTAMWDMKDINRLFMGPQVDYVRVITHVAMRPSVQDDLVRRNYLEHFEHWLQGQTALKKARVQKLSNTLAVYTRNTRKCHPKGDEKMWAVDLLGRKAANARAILDYDDDAAVRLGFWIEQAQQMVHYILLSVAPTLDFDYIPVCGLDALQLGCLINELFQDYHYVLGLDYSLFDNSVTSAAHRFEERVVHELTMHAMPDDVRHIYADQCRHRHVTNRRLGVDLWIQGRRNSGDPNTTLGNSILSGQSVWDSMTAAGLRGKVLCCGDDTLIFSDHLWTAEELAHFQRGVERHGFAVKVESNVATHTVKMIQDISQITFLAARPLPATDASGERVICMTPTYGRCLYKLFFSLSKQTVANPLGFMRTLAESFLATYGYDPIFNKVMTKVLSYCKDAVRVRNVKTDSYFIDSFSRVYGLRLHADAYTFNNRRYTAQVATLLTEAVDKYVTGEYLVMPLEIPSEVVDQDHQ